MCKAPEVPQVNRSVQTDVAVYLGDCSGNGLNVVCDGTSIESQGSTWQRARWALAYPTPRGPYPVSQRFTIFIYETSGYAITGTRVLATFRIDVRCEGTFAYASVRTAQFVADLAPTPYLIGDDVVTVARHVLETAT